MPLNPALSNRPEPRTVTLALALAWLGTLDLAYATLVYPINAYMGYTFVPDPGRVAVSVGCTVLLATLLPGRTTRPAAFFAHFFFTVAAVPCLAYFSMAGRDYFPALSIVAASTLLILILRGDWRVALPTLREGPRLAPAICLLGVGLSLTGFIATQGIPSFNFDLTQVYDLRREVALGGGLGHIVFWGAGVFNPLLLALALWRRHLIMFGMLCVLQALFFAYTGNKIMLFQPLLVAGVFFVFRFKWPAAALTTVLLAFCAAVMAITWYAPTVGQLISDFTVRRVLFGPAFLNFAYYEVFAKLDHVFLSNSVLSALSAYPHGALSTGQVVASQVGWAVDANATNGFLGTGFMHFGLGGALLFAGCVGLLVKLLDSFAGRGMPGWVIVAAGVAPYRALLTEADVPTSVMTHGVGLVLLLLWLMTRKSPAIGSGEWRSVAFAGA